MGFYLTKCQLKLLGERGSVGVLTPVWLCQEQEGNETQDPDGKAALLPVPLRRPLLTRVSIVPVDRGEILQHPRQWRVDLDLRGSK